MRKIVLLIFILLSCLEIAFCAQETSPPLSLSDCYRLALRQSESLAIRAEAIQEAEARLTQSLSGILPKVHFSYSDKRQDGNNSNSFSLREIPEHKFTLSQPLFSGFKEFAAMAASKAEVRQKTYQKLRAEQLLFLDVVEAFYLFLGYQEEQEVLKNMREALIERVMELKKREELGRSRLNEVASVEARLSRLEADLEWIKSESEITKHLLEFLTGINISSLVDEGMIPVFSLRPDELELRSEERADVLAAQESLEKSQKEVTVAQSGFWPELSLDGNYYTKRVGNAGQVDWDITLSAQVPLFEGGENIGKLKEAQSIRDQEGLRYQEIQRKALLDIRNALTRWESAVRRLEAVEKALAAAEKNYDLQKQDYQINLVSNLEVLQALEETEDMRRDFINIKNEAMRGYWQLKVALGEGAP